METKELVMNKKTNGKEKIKSIFESLNNQDSKRLVEAINTYVNWFDLFSNDGNRWEFAKQSKINNDICLYCVMRNCEDLYNYHQFEPEINITIECKDGSDIRTCGSGAEGGCIDVEIYEFQDLIKSIYKEVKKSRSIFSKKDPDDI